MTPKVWASIAAIVTALVGGGATSTYVIGQVAEVRQEQDAVRKSLETDRKAGWQTQQDVEVIKERLKQVEENAKEIKGDVKELLRRVR